jgi:uncharacterized protein YndB with AHSA1/START domain
MDDIVVEHTYAYSIEQVWESLTDPAAVADWLMPGDFRAVVGHRVRLHCEPVGAFDGWVDLEVLEVTRPRRLSYSWRTGDMQAPTIVTYTLTALPDGRTRLRLEHTGFTGENGRATYPWFKQGWGRKLGEQLPRTVAKRISDRTA